MSKYIPFDIQVEIFKRLPVKSLIKFRKVLKSWKSLIENSEFIAGYGVRHTQPHSLLVRYNEHDESEDKYVCFDDDTLVQQLEFPLTVPNASILKYSTVVGCSNGLLCLYGYSYYYQKTAVIWIPSIKKSVEIFLPQTPYVPNMRDVVSFGVCPISSDPTIINISYGVRIPWLLEIFTLSSRTWTSKRIQSPRESIKYIYSNVNVKYIYSNVNVVGIDRFIYYVATDQKCFAMDGQSQTINMIISFDMTTQEFEVIDLPHCLSHQFYINLSNLWDSVAVLQYKMNNQKQVCDVWIMDHGATNSFTKLYTINTPYANIKTIGFMKNGKPIIGTRDDLNKPFALVSYEPNSGHLNDLGVYGSDFSFFMSSYMKTLLLLDQLDCIIFCMID